MLFCFLHVIAEAKSNPKEDPAQEQSSGILNISSESKNIEIFTDLLLWSASQSGSENWSEIFTTSGSTTNVDILAVDFGWDVGLRAGLNYGMKDDQWDTQLVYTWFRSDGKENVGSTGDIHSPFLGNFYIGNADGSKDSGPGYHNANIRWTILFHMFDLELGRKFFESSPLSFRPFLGIKGGWINQSINSTWQNPTSGSFTSATENLKNNFWGLGPSFGLNSRWQWWSLGNHLFNLFADFSGAMMYGHWTFNDRYLNNGGAEVSIASSDISGGATMFRIFSGLGWKTSSVSMRCGYEVQVWLDQLRFYSLNMGRLNTPLTFQGVAFDLQVTF